MPFEESLYFFKQFQTNFHTVGSVLPTSPFAAATMASECARHRGPKRVLEVGAGTGAITAEIVKHLGPDDRLMLCEIQHEFVEFLRERFERDPNFKQVKAQSEVLEISVLDLPVNQKFDYIISAIPFNNCPADFVAAVFEHYRQLLKPGGVLTYIEYMGGRALKLQLANGDTTNPIYAINEWVERELVAHEFRRDSVWRNIPPAWVHHLRFAPAEAAQADALAPLMQTNRVSFGEMGFDQDAVLFAGGLGLAAWLLKKAAPKPSLWLLPAVAAALAGLFLRDPNRRVFRDTSVAYSACDGSVLSVTRVQDERFGPGEWLCIATFLSITDVHVNRAPIAGKVIQIIEEEGGFAMANTQDAEHNMAQYTLIEDAKERRCVVVQRTGMIARRIVNRARMGNLLAQGERFGLIRFGSRVDVYLPADHAVAAVQPGDRVEGGTTVIARWA